MSDTEEMRRLILHAATLLDVQCDRIINAQHDLKAVVAAAAHGRAVLRMVAACMATETDVLPVARRAAKPSVRDENGRFIKGGAS